MKKSLLKKLSRLPKASASAFGRQISAISTPSRTIKIAVTGLSRTGKTVFITSLIDQLLHQHRLVSFTASRAPFNVEIKPPLHHVRRFDYYTFVEQLKNSGTWPDGTDSISHTLLCFERKSRFAFIGSSTFTIELIDYPGEWIFDLNLIGLSYEQWSEQTLQWLREIDEPQADAYLRSVASLNEQIAGPEAESALHREYKTVIADLKKNHYSQITPGRFIIPADLANDPILHFAPLDNTATALAAAFKARYERYVQEIVKEIHLKHFKGFERQIVLVDVIEALQNGYKCYRDMKAGLKAMLSLYEHKRKNIIAQWFSPSIKRVLFVATKADQVAAPQHANFSALLDEMIEALRRRLDIAHIQTGTQIVSSLKSTVTIEKKHEGELLGFVRGTLAEDGQLHDLYPGKMPSSFPAKESWDSDLYAFKSFLPPQRSYRENEALEHINMDKLIEKLLGDLL